MALQAEGRPCEVVLTLKVVGGRRWGEDDALRLLLEAEWSVASRPDLVCTAD